MARGAFRAAVGLEAMADSEAMWESEPSEEGFEGPEGWDFKCFSRLLKAIDVGFRRGFDWFSKGDVS